MAPNTGKHRKIPVTRFSQGFAATPCVHRRSSIVAASKKAPSMPTKRTYSAASAGEADASQEAASNVAAQEARRTAACDSDTREKLQEAIIERVLEFINLEGLTKQILDEVAKKYAAQVRVDRLIEMMLHEEEHVLTEKLAAKVLECLKI